MLPRARRHYARESRKQSPSWPSRRERKQLAGRSVPPPKVSPTGNIQRQVNSFGVYLLSRNGPQRYRTAPRSLRYAEVKGWRLLAAKYKILQFPKAAAPQKRLRFRATSISSRGASTESGVSHDRPRRRYRTDHHPCSSLVASHLLGPLPSTDTRAICLSLFHLNGFGETERS